MSLLSRTFFNIGDLQLLSGVDQAPHLEVPYPLTNGGQQLRYASGRCPVHAPTVTCILVYMKTGNSMFLLIFGTWEI